MTRLGQLEGDRTQYVPPHNGPNVLPNFVFFCELLRHAHRRRLAVRDVRTNVERTYADLLLDALSLRAVIEGSLSQDVRRKLEDQQEEVCIGVLAPGGHEYTAAILAVWALGAVVVPMTVALPVEEAVYFVEKSRQVAILNAVDSGELSQSISRHVGKKTGQPIPTIDISPNLARQTTTKIEDVVISSNLHLDDNAAGIIIFTSGTTGPPKGAVQRRNYIHEASRTVIDFFNLGPQDTILHVLPVHHVTGLAINILPFLVAGACIEFRSGGFDAEWTWERWRQGGITIFSGVPTIYMRMMRFYQQRLSKLPDSERESYDRGARQFRAMICGTSALPRPVQDFWTNLRQGQVILTRYGSTEVGAVLRVSANDQEVPDGSVGEVTPGIDLKLSEGDEGEILVKGAQLFAKYLHDGEATASTHDENGYFKTGDMAIRQGKYYFITGRASQDILKSGGYKISALDIEREVLALPYIGEVMVVGVDDLEFGQRVAAAISLREDQEDYSVRGESGRPKLTIDDLRRDLRARLAGYKMPTLLRVVEGDLPKTASGKVMKKVLGPELFPAPGWEKVKEIQVWQPSKL